MPAFCSPLNGVTIFCGAPGSQPRLNGTLGSLNHTPRWYWWAGANVVVPPGDTENVSASKMPLTVALPNPLSLVWMSLWYHETPNGAVGCWITNRSNPVLGGMPCRLTFMVSFSDPVVMVACPPAFGRHAEMAGDDGLSPNENVCAVAGRADAPAVVPNAAARPAAAIAAPAATTPALAAAVPRTRRAEDRMLVICCGLPVGGGVLSSRPGGARPRPWRRSQDIHPGSGACCAVGAALQGRRNQDWGASGPPPHGAPVRNSVRSAPGAARGRGRAVIASGVGACGRRCAGESRWCSR